MNKDLLLVGALALGAYFLLKPKETGLGNTPPGTTQQPNTSTNSGPVYTPPTQAVAIPIAQPITITTPNNTTTATTFSTVREGIELLNKALQTGSTIRTSNYTVVKSTPQTNTSIQSISGKLYRVSVSPSK